VKITASTPFYALLGHPVGQSLSPILQNGWIGEHGFDGVYVALDIDPNNFDSALLGLHHCGLRGANVTTPFKEVAARGAIALSKRARDTLSANCLSHHPQGFEGDSTDGAGFILDLHSRAPGWRDVDGPVVLIGAGGAARAILHALVEAGVTDIYVVNRDAERAQDAIAMLTSKTVSARPLTALGETLIGAGLVINATSAGFNGNNPLDVDFSQTLPDCIVYDSVYVPRQTAFLQGAQSQKRRTLDGLGMLVGQGALAFETWFGVRPNFQTGLARLEAELSA
jgi:shikimate dehydrogenase